jgi:hypothetical protein
MKTPRLLLAVAACAALAGCITLQTEHVLTGRARTPWSGEVKVSMEGAQVAGEYEEVAIVTATGRAMDATLPAVVGALQQQAAALGCNAIIRVRYDRGAQAATATGVAVWMR